MNEGEIYRTDHLTARRITDADVDALYAVYGDADAMRWVGDGRPIEREACVEWVAVTRRNYATRGYGMSALVLRETGAVIGFCGIVHPRGQVEPEIKYALLRVHWGKGLATEAVRGMLAYGVERFALRRVIATTDPENAASHRVLFKAGMTRIEDVRDEDGETHRTFVWLADGEEQEG